jgi:hypothetical protein
LIDFFAVAPTGSRKRARPSSARTVPLIQDPIAVKKTPGKLLFLPGVEVKQAGQNWYLSSSSNWRGSERVLCT